MMRKANCVLICSVLFYSCLSVPLFADDSAVSAEAIPSAQAILDSMLSHCEALPACSWHGEVTRTWESEADSGGVVVECEFRWDRTRSDCIRERYDLIDGQKVPTRHERDIWDGQRFFTTVTSIEGSERTFRRAILISGDEYKIHSLGDPLTGWYLEGYVWPEEGLLGLLRETPDLKVRPEAEDVDGHRCYVLERSVSSGYMHLWIDPEAGYNIRRIVHEQKLDFEIHETTVDDIEIRLVEGAWVPMSASYRLVDRNPDGTVTSESTATYRRTQLEFDPDFESVDAFEMDGIPNGAHVGNADSPDSDYTWQDGELVPKPRSGSWEG